MVMTMVNGPYFQKCLLIIFLMLILLFKAATDRPNTQPPATPMRPKTHTLNNGAHRSRGKFGKAFWILHTHAPYMTALPPPLPAARDGQNAPDFPESSQPKESMRAVAGRDDRRNHCVRMPPPSLT